MASDRRYFKFNLLPPKSESEVQAEKRRDKTTIYAFMLVAFASFIYLIIVLVTVLWIDPRRQATINTLAERQQVENTYAQIRSLHGELFIKTKTLTPVLEKNIDTVEIFRVTEQMKGLTSGIIIESYTRERSGTFVFQILNSSILEIPSIVSGTQAIQGVNNVFVRSVVISTNGLVRTTIALDIEQV